MTKKDFELIAGCIIACKKAGLITSDSIADYFAIELANKNPRFNKEKFLRACGCDIENICEYCDNRKLCDICGNDKE
jgi:hypothetical protein